MGKPSPSTISSPPMAGASAFQPSPPIACASRRTSFSAAEIARASAVALPVQRKSRVIVARGRDVRAFGPKRPGNVGGLPCGGEQYLGEWPGWELASQMQDAREASCNRLISPRTDQRFRDGCGGTTKPAISSASQKKAAEAKASQPGISTERGEAAGVATARAFGILTL